MKKGICAVLSLLLMLTGCQVAETPEYVVPEEMDSVVDTVLAQNDHFTLEWDDATRIAFMRDKQSGRVWGTTPYEFYESGDFNLNLLSALTIDYVDLSDASLQTGYGVDCVDDNAVSAKAIENGVHLTYYFRTLEITVGVSYRLRKDSIEVSMNTADLEEAGDCRLMSVSLTPYLCSAKNTAEKTSYLFVPSGSGALMYTDDSPDGLERQYSGEVYGDDLSRKDYTVVSEEEAIRMPVFGIKEGNHALCGIIEESAGSAVIKATAGNPRDGYSGVGATFYVRGFNNTEWDTGKQSAGTQLFQDAILLDESWPENRQYTVGYYPLSGEDADYNGMAACYRNYLIEKGQLQKSALKQHAYHVTFLGGAKVKKFVAGIPYHTVTPLTTFRQAQDILQELNKSTGSSPQVMLKGYGTTGLDAGKVAGGFTFSSALGGNKQQQELEAYCAQSRIGLFSDFDVVQFAVSGKGYTTFDSTALTANSQSARIYPLKRNVYMEDENVTPIRLIKRSKLASVIEKLCSFTQDRVSGVSLTTFGSMAYSDYHEELYAIKGSLEEQAQMTIDALKKAGHAVSLSAANACAAGLADSITDVPLQDGGYLSLDAMVPFYELVYRGSMPLYSTPLNVAANAQDLLLRAVEAGVSPAFTLTATMDIELAGSQESMYFGVVYEGNKSLITDTIRQVADYITAIGDAAIISHTIVEDGLTRTVFSNGVTVYVNRTDLEQMADGLIVAANSFQFIQQ